MGFHLFYLIIPYTIRINLFIKISNCEESFNINVISASRKMLIKAYFISFTEFCKITSEINPGLMIFLTNHKARDSLFFKSLLTSSA